MGGTGSREKACPLSSSTSGCALIIFSNGIAASRNTGSRDESIIPLCRRNTGMHFSAVLRVSRFFCDCWIERRWRIVPRSGRSDPFVSLVASPFFGLQVEHLSYSWKFWKKYQQSVRAYFEPHRSDSKENFSNLMKWDRITGLTSN